MNLIFIRSIFLSFICMGLLTACQTTRSVPEIRRLENSSMKAQNLTREGKYDEAIAELDETLKANPEIPGLHRQMGHILTLTKKYTEAEASLTRALQLDSNSPLTYGYFGLLYYSKGDFQKALESNIKAHELLPEEPNYYYEIGANYNRLNDRDNALKYLSMYLKQGDSDEKKKEIVRLMKDINVEVPSYQNSVAVLIEQKKFNEADDLLKSIQNNKSVDENGDSELTKVYNEIRKTKDARLVLLEWRNKNSKSAFAASLLGMALMDYAWEARGEGYKATISAEAWKTFEERIEQAKVYLNDASKLDPTNMQTSVGLIIAARAIKATRSEAREIYKKATKAFEPDDYYIQMQMLETLKPKWGGKISNMMEFARYQLGNPVPTSKAPILLALAHWELAHQYYSDSFYSYFSKSENWDECKKAFDISVNRFPNSVEIRTLYLRTAMYAGYTREACLQYDKIKNRMNLKYWDSVREFIEIKQRMKLGIGCY